MIVYQLRCGLILTGMQSTIRFVRQVCPTCGLVLGRREADRLSEDHLYTPQTENIKKIIYKYVDLYNLHIHINIHACIFMHRSLCSNMFPFFSGSGSSSVLNFTEEGASMPSERADHSIVNYHDETPGAVDDVLTVRALVSNNFDTFVGEKINSIAVIWWFDDDLIVFLEILENVYIYIYRSNLLGDIGRWFFIQFFCQVRFCRFLDEFSWKPRSSVDFEPLGDTMPKLPLSAWSGQWKKLGSARHQNPLFQERESC